MEKKCHDCDGDLQAREHLTVVFYCPLCEYKRELRMHRDVDIDFLNLHADPDGLIESITLEKFDDGTIQVDPKDIKQLLLHKKVD